MAAKLKDPDRKVGFGRLVLWQTSSVSVALSTLVMNFVNVYCTDTLHLDFLVVSTIFMVTKIIDAVTDMVVGVIIDRTNTRWGKGRPYEIFMAFLWLTTWLLFSTPESFSNTAKYIWLGSMYIFTNAICKTFLNGNNVVYLARAFKTNEQQVKVTAYGGFFTMGASLVFNVTFPMAMTRIATSAAGWSRLIALFAVPLTIIGLLRMLTIKEQYNNDSDIKASGEKLRLHDAVTLITGNRYLLIIMAVSLIMTTITSMGTNTYYWKWIVGNVDLMGVTSVFTILGLPLAFLMPMWTRKFGLGLMCKTGFAVVALGYLFIFFVGGNIVPLVACTMLTSIGCVPYTMMKNIFIVNLANYNEYSDRARMEGTMSALIGLVEKIGAAVGGFILGVLMTVGGYNGALEVQPDSALLMIRICMSILPAIAFGGIVMLLGLYKLDKIMPELKAKWEERKVSSNV